MGAPHECAQEEGTVVFLVGRYIIFSSSCGPELIEVFRCRLLQVAYLNFLLPPLSPRKSGITVVTGP